METPEFDHEEKHKESLAKYQINPNRAMFTIILSIFVDNFGFFMVMPLLPQLTLRLGASELLYGLLISSNAIMILIFAPIWGKLSDKYGRKSILVISQIGTGFAFFTLIFSDSILIILIGRLIDGIFSGQMPIIRAYISDITTPETRASHFGKIMTGFSASIIIAPLIGGVLGFFNFRFPMIFACGFTIISVILTKTLLVESMPKERIEDLKIQRELLKESQGEIKGILSKEVGLRFVELFILSLISMIFSTSFSLVLYSRFTANTLMIGGLMAFSGIFIMIYGLFFMKKLILRLGERKMFYLGMVIFISIFLIYPFLKEFWMFFVLIIPYSFSSVSIGPLISSNLTKAVGPDKQGQLGGWTTYIAAISQTISPIIATLLLSFGTGSSGVLLLGINNGLLGVLLLVVVSLDIKRHPKLYSYEKIRRKRLAIQKRKKKAAKQKKKEEKQIKN